MRMTFTAALAIGLALAFGQSAEAVPAAPAAIAARSAANLPLQQAQYRAHRTRHGLVKCYRTLVIGPYRCHYYRRPWW